jgi:RNA polymerase sigma-70 factor, ECF subfamily
MEVQLGPVPQANRLVCPAEHIDGRRGNETVLAEDFHALLDAARAGSESALSSLYGDLHPKVLRYLRAQESSEAEDLASEVWMDVAAGLLRFAGDESDLRRWVFTIAHRRLIDLRRARRRRRTVALPPERMPEPRPPGDVEAEAMENLSTQAALLLVAALPHDQAEVVLLRVLGGLSVKDVASILGKRPGTVRVIQHRALERLAGSIARGPYSRRSPRSPRAV